MPAIKQLNIERYNLDPKLCLHCRNILSYDDRFHKFCSRSCSGQFTNIRIDKSFSNEKIDAKLAKRNIKRLDEYINVHTPLNWQCLECDYIWNVTPDNIFSKNVGCPRCSGRVLSNNVIDERLIDRAIKRVDDYISSTSKINWQCLECNHIWLAEPRCIVSLDSGCPICNIPGCNERLLLKLLSDNNIVYEPQFSIRKLESSLPAYRLDAYLPTHKLAIEYNGRQHYEATRFGSKYTEKDFSKQIARDEFVRNICHQFNIKLIEIDGREYYGKKKLTKYITENILNLLK